MRKSEILLAAIAAALLLTGCVTTTTVSNVPESNANDQDAAELNYQLGARYLRNGNYDLARDRLLLSIELDPKNPVAHYTLALTYEQLENERLATESYERAVRIAPRNYNVQNAYAVFLCKQRDYDQARKHFDRAIRVPENDDAEITMTNAGVCMMQKPDNAAAEAYLRAALERRPNYGEALLQMSVLSYETGDALRARAFLQRYLSGNVPSAPVLYHGIRIEEKLGDDTARREYTLQLLRDFPDSAEAERIRQSG